MSYTGNEILETADTDNAHRSDTSNFLNQSCHYAVTSLRNEEDVGSSLQFEAGPPHSIKFFVDHLVRQIVCSAKSHVEVSVV